MTRWKKASRVCNLDKRPSRIKQEVRENTHRSNRRKAKRAIQKGEEPQDRPLDDYLIW